MAHRQALELSDVEFARDVDKLIETLERELAGTNRFLRHRRAWTAVLSLVAVTGLILALHQAGFFDRNDKHTKQIDVGTTNPATHSEPALILSKPIQTSAARRGPSPSNPKPVIEGIHEPKNINLLAPENGGHLVIAPSESWTVTIDGKEDGTYIAWGAGQEAVYAFKDEWVASFDTFSVLIPGSDDNVKEFELLIANDSPTGFFESIGIFQTQNVRLFT